MINFTYSIQLMLGILYNPDALLQFDHMKFSGTSHLHCHVNKIGSINFLQQLFH